MRRNNNIIRQGFRVQKTFQRFMYPEQKAGNKPLLN